MKKALFRVSFILIFTIGIFNQAKAQPGKDYQSLLWEVIHPDNPNNPTYLYGTMHVSRRLAFNLSDTFFMALNKADLIALESEPTKWLDEVMNLKYATDYFGYFPSNSFTNKGFYQKIFPLDPPLNEDLGYLLSSRDLMINSLQYRNSPYMMDFEEDTYLDMFIHQAGAKTGRPVVGLEDIVYTSELRRIASAENQNQKDDKVIPLWLEEKLKEQDLGTIFEDSYRQQDLDLLQAITDIFQSDHFRKWFLYERNRLMADSLYILAAKQRVFAGVGAAHLPGNDGMITYLRQKGCKVRPVKFLKTEYATVEKNNYDSLKVDLKLTLQESPDKQFSMLYPSKLYELPYSGKHFLSSDMTNGSFVSIFKQNTFNFINGMKPEKYIEKIDSLLFENIPGNIISQKKIQVGPYKGIEVKNKTKTGNHQHYKIFATPFEVVVFKVGGNNDFIVPWSDSIFNSLKFKEHGNEWKKEQFIYGGFSVQVPEWNLFDNNSPISGAYNVPTLQAYDAKSGNYFMVTKNILYDFNYIEEDNFELERTAEKVAKKHKMEVGKKKLFTYNGLPTLDFVLSKKGSKKEINFRMIISGAHYYLLAASIEKNKGQLAQFMESFQIEEFAYQKPFENYVDTMLHFSTMTCKDINESVVKTSYRYEKPKDYEEVTESYIYKSESGERIFVKFEKFHQYTHYATIDSLWNEVIENATKTNSLLVRERKSFEKDGKWILDAMLIDTGSFRAIKLRAILKKGGDVCYIMKTLVDTLKTSSPFIDAFYGQFTPKDSIFGKSVFSDKGNLFLDDLFSKDTASFRKAISSIKQASLDSSHLTRVFGIMNSYPFEANNREYVRSNLLNMLSYVQDDRLLDFSKNLYFENPGNYPAQLAAISIIAAQKNRKALETFREILEQDLPFIMDNDRYVLSPLRFDSMSLWKELYPDMFQYDHVEEYKSIIFYDLNRMLDSGVIDAMFYESFLPKLVDESSVVLKRHLASEQKKKLEQEKKKALDEGKSSSPTMYPNYSLVQKYKLLLPYSENDEAKRVIDNYDNLINSEIDKIYMIRSRLKFNLPVSGKDIDKIASEPNYTLKLYEQLDEEGKISLIPVKHIQDERLAILALNSGAYYYSRFDLEKDTFKVIITSETKIRGLDYRIYFFEINQYVSESARQKYNFSKKDFQKIAILAVELRNGKVYPVGSVYQSNQKIQNPERMDKYMEEMEEEFIVQGRKRASAKEVTSQYYDYLD
jgi:uncharacterized protein YbaP (TraB family)